MINKQKNIIKKDIVENLYNEVGFPKKELTNIVNDVFTTISDALTSKQDVKINSFGVFNIKNKKQRVVYNPKTKEPNVITARYVVNFNPSKKFRAFLKEK